MNELARVILLLGDRGHVLRIYTYSRILHFQVYTTKNEQRYSIERNISLILLNRFPERADKEMAEEILKASDLLRDRMP